MITDFNKIYNMDCLEGIKQIPDNSIDLVVTSPPYNVNLGNNRYNDFSYSFYNDDKEYEDYIKWLCSIFKEISRVLKFSGRICINIGDGKNGTVPTSSDISHFMTNELNYLSMAHIIWNKNTTSNRTAWGSFMSPSSPSFPSSCEHIMVFAKGSRKLEYQGETDLVRDEFIEWAYGLWTFAPENRQKEFNHPAMFPEELPKRCIKMLSWIGATVLDPFMGSGTTAVVCKKLKRNFVGFEIDKNYYDLANERIEHTKISKRLF
jgi:DNA modification methylase